jgi:hypothetical protein
LRIGYIGGEVEDLDDAIVAAGFLQVVSRHQISEHLHDGHFDQYLEELAKELVTKGVTGFWISLPYSTLHSEVSNWHQLKPRTVDSGATFLGLIVSRDHNTKHDSSEPRNHVKEKCISCRGSPVETQEREIAEAIRTVTEAPATFMGEAGDEGRGILMEGKRADLVVLDDDGEVLQTWIGGKKVWSRS